MNGLKKKSLSLGSLLLATSITQVAHATVIQDQCVRQHGGWYVEVEPFWARAKDSLLTTLPFAETNINEFEFTPTGTFSSRDNRAHTFDSDYEWGYRVAVGYDFPSCTCCTYGFSLEYTYHKAEDDRHIGPFVNSDGAPALFSFFSFFGPDTTNADANYDFKYYAIDLLGHRTSTICNCVDLQFFAGARYVRLKEDHHRHLFVPDELVDDAFDTGSDVSDFFSDHKTRFDGVGPRVGFNVFYQFAHGFGLVTEAAGNLVFGCSDSEYSESISEFFSLGDDDVGVFEGTHHNKVDRHANVVPGLSGKVALAYRATFRNCSSLAIEAGYRGDKYFGIADHSTIVFPDAFDEGFNKDGVYHDYDLSGPYISISFHA